MNKIPETLQTNSMCEIPDRKWKKIIFNEILKRQRVRNDNVVYFTVVNMVYFCMVYFCMVYFCMVYFCTYREIDCGRVW
jgi:hypothetical protein